jgi:integron integrase
MEDQPMVDTRPYTARQSAAGPRRQHRRQPERPETELLRDPAHHEDSTIDRPAAVHLLKAIQAAIRARNYSHRTEESYLGWIRRFIRFHGRRHPARLGENHVRDFLNDLALHRRVSASTQSQALSALLFLYGEVLGRDVSWIHGITRPKKPKRLPIVLSHDETTRVLNQLHGTRRLMAALLYGSGLRLNECLGLRVKDIDLEREQILVRAGKGDRDRITFLPHSLKPVIEEHLKQLRPLYERDAAGQVSATLPGALGRKMPSAGAEWAWAYVFPSRSRITDKTTGKRYRHHVHESVLQRAVKEAVRKSGITKRATCHTFRHSFATHLLEAGCNIRMIQKLLGHKDLRTTMQYTHVASGSKMGVKSPIDLLKGFK